MEHGDAAFGYAPCMKKQSLLNMSNADFCLRSAEGNGVCYPALRTISSGLEGSTKHLVYRNFFGRRMGGLDPSAVWLNSKA